MDHETSERLHSLVMELVRASGMLQPDWGLPDLSLTLSQAFAIHELDTDTPLSQRELGQRLNLEKSTVSRMAADLERKGLLERVRDPDNRRLYRMRLTDEGRTTHAWMSTAFHDRYAHSAANMSTGERESLITGLSALVRAMREDDDTGTQ